MAETVEETELSQEKINVTTSGESKIPHSTFSTEWLNEIDLSNCDVRSLYRKGKLGNVCKDMHRMKIDTWNIRNFLERQWGIYVRVTQWGKV